LHGLKRFDEMILDDIEMQQHVAEIQKHFVVDSGDKMNICPHCGGRMR
jgi:hypothetical protein